MDSTSSISYGAGVKDLKAKSVAAALERVSVNIHRHCQNETKQYGSRRSNFPNHMARLEAEK